MRNAKASLGVEGYNKKGEKLVLEQLNGDITHEEFIKRALEIVKWDTQ